MSPDIQHLISSEKKKKKEERGVIFGRFDAVVVQEAIPNCCNRAANVTRGHIF